MSECYRVKANASIVIPPFMTRFAAIIPNYNTGSHIGAALACLLGQTRPYDDILIIDDGSTDDSVAVIQSLIRDQPRARLLRNEKNMGVVATLNRGIDCVDADYIHMVSANDTYYTDLVRRCEMALGERPDIAIFCGNGVFHYKEKGRTRPVFMHLPQHPSFIGPAEFQDHVRTNPLTFFGGGIILRRESVLLAGKMDEGLRWHADWALYYLLALQYGVYFIPEPLVTIEVSDESYSSQALQWDRQKYVIHHLIASLGTRQDGMGAIWKRVALLPTYDLRACTLLARPECRWYVTPLLLWRLLIHSLAYWLKYLFPRKLLLSLRPLFRV